MRLRAILPEAQSVIPKDFEKLSDTWASKWTGTRQLQGIPARRQLLTDANTLATLRLMKQRGVFDILIATEAPAAKKLAEEIEDMQARLSLMQMEGFSTRRGCP